jgi:hypothetical protein
MSEILPLTFNYDEPTRTVDVEFGDGSIVRYFDIDPRLAFLSPTNERRNRDFFAYLEFTDWNNRVVNRHPPLCPGLRGIPCTCPLRVKSEVIREAIEENGTPQSRPVLVQQQSGRHQ